MRIPVKWGIILAVAIALWTLIIHALGIHTDRIQYASIVDIVVIVIYSAIIGTGLAALRSRQQEGEHS